MTAQHANLHLASSKSHAVQMDGEPQGVILQGKYARLRPLAQNDYGYFYDLSLSAENNARWRYRGTTPSPERFVTDLWTGVQAQFVIETPEPRQRAGLVVAYNADMANGTVYLAALVDNDYHRKVWPMEGILLFVDYLLQNWNFRKVYAETPEFCAAQFASGAGTFFEEEGRLTQHQFFQGKYWDYITYALTRERWQTHGKAALNSFSGMT